MSTYGIDLQIRRVELEIESKKRQIERKQKQVQALNEERNKFLQAKNGGPRG